MDSDAFQAGRSDTTRVVNKHLASPPPKVNAMPITETMSPTKGAFNFHTGPDVEKYGHARLGDGQPISDVVGGRIHVKGAASDLAHSPAHMHHHHHHHVHHTADGTAVDDPRREFIHDGTTYATGASGEPYNESEGARPGLASRIKEAIPGTREHREKLEREGDEAVYM